MIPVRSRDIPINTPFLKRMGITTKKPRKKRERKEEGLQMQCLRWFGLQYPKLMKYWIHIPNGAALSSFIKNGVRICPEAMRMKKLGLRLGASDLFLAIPKFHVPYGGLWVEMKFGDEGVVSKEQREFLKDMEEIGYCKIVCRTFEEFQATAKWYLNL